MKMPVFFHSDQLSHKPLFEWAFGDKLPHPETTHRAESILAALESDPSAFSIRAPERFPLAAIKETHNQKLMTLYRAAMKLPLDQTFYPSVFPRRDVAVPNPDDVRHAGFFCYDSGTPLNATTWAAAAWSAACALEAAKLIEDGRERVAYALCRPPGHHASRDLFGGYCYFNNAALAAKRLRKRGKVAVIDIDFHHGNGTQSLFYRDNRVFVASIHGDPKEFYPYFSGTETERGAGEGKGYNLNVPLPSGCDGQEYVRILDRQVLPKLREFDPDALVVSAGFDTYAGDPIGAFSLETPDYAAIGERIAGALEVPAVIVQEGGYAAEALGLNVRTFLTGFLGRG